MFAEGCRVENDGRTAIRETVSMSASLSSTSRSGDSSWRWVPLLLLALVSAMVGNVLARAATAFDSVGPAVMVAVPAVLILAVVAFGRPLIGIAVIVVSFPFGTIALPTGPVSLQAVELGVVLVAVVVALHRLARGTTMLPLTPHLWWLLGLIGCALLALPSAIDQELALKQVAQLIGGFLYVTCVIAACREMTDVRRLMTLFVLVAAAIALVSLMSQGEFRSSLGGSVVSGRAEGTFDQPNQLGSFSALAAFVAVGLAMGGRAWRERSAMLVSFGLVTGALLLSLSRGAWIGTAAAVVFLAFAMRRSRRLILAVAIPILFVAAMAGALASSSPQVAVITQRIESFTVRSPYDNRPAIWAEAYREIADDPWTGQGPGSFPVASARASSEATTTSADHAHNLWLTWAAESGIPAALMLTGFIVAVGLGAAQALRAAGNARDRAMVVGLTAAMITLLGQGIVDYTLRNAVVFFAALTVIGAFLATWRIATTSTR